MKMQMLWEYQIADLALGRFESALKKSKTRSHLLTVRNELVEEQNKAKKLDNSLKEAYEDSVRISAEIEKIQKQVTALKKEAENCKDQDLRQVRLVFKATDDCNRTLNAMIKQIEQIYALAQGAETTLREVRNKMAAGKKEFDAIKELHDKELADATQELERLRAAVSQKEADIPSELLEQYKKVKRTRVNPVAKVKDNQCSGCNMTIPSLMLSKLRTADAALECDSCGRILYYQDHEG